MENLVPQQGMLQNPENIFLTMLALLVFASRLEADLINHTYWAYITNPPLLQVVEWTDIGLVISTNGTTHIPPPWSLEGTTHPEEEGRQINISLGYEILPLWTVKNHVNTTKILGKGQKLECKRFIFIYSYLLG